VQGNALQLLFDVLVLVTSLALEELTPKFGGIGLPLLLVASATLASRRSLIMAVLFGLAAGGAEDAVSALPVMLSTSYFLGISLWARYRQLPRVSWILMYPGYQLWLGLWTSGIGGSIFSRLLMALVLGVPVLLALPAVVRFLERKAGVDEIA